MGPALQREQHFEGPKTIGLEKHMENIGERGRLSAQTQGREKSSIHRRLGCVNGMDPNRESVSVSVRVVRAGDAKLREFLHW